MNLRLFCDKIKPTTPMLSLMLKDSKRRLSIVSNSNISNINLKFIIFIRVFYEVILHIVNKTYQTISYNELKQILGDISSMKEIRIITHRIDV